MKKIYRIIISSILLILSLIFKDIPFIYFISYILISYDVIINSFKKISKKELFDEEFLMTIATFGAIIINEQVEAILIMLFYQIGEMLQDNAIEVSKKSINSLLNLKVEYANVLINNDYKKINVDDVKINDIILIKPGEKIPVDGIIIKGNTMLDTSNLTGESVYKKALVNDKVLSGTININNPITIKVTKEYKDSMVNKILEFTTNAQKKKSIREKKINKFANYYTKIVVIISLILFIIPSFIFNQDINTWLYRSLSFLVASCPCALVISIPLSFFIALGKSSDIGVLVKGSNYLEKICEIDTFVFDKTGTLTKGEFSVIEINPKNISKDELLMYATYADYFSNHPISLSLQKKYKKKIDSNIITDTKEFVGNGVYAKVDNKEVLVGNYELLKDNNIILEKVNKEGTIIYVSLDNIYIGYILIGDTIKDESYKLINYLNKNNKEVIMLTGDNLSISKSVCKSLKINKYYANLLPIDKANIVNDLSNNNKKVLFMGDGINDAIVLSSSYIGVSMGNISSDSITKLSDIVIMNDDVSKLIDLINISKKTLRIVRENIIFAISIKLFILTLSVLGYSSMWHSVFSDVGVTIITILNSFRILKLSRK